MQIEWVSIDAGAEPKLSVWEEGGGYARANGLWGTEMRESGSDKRHAGDHWQKRSRVGRPRTPYFDAT